MRPELYWLLGIALLTLATLFIRFLPFLVFRDPSKTPAWVQYLSRVLPAAVMALLAVYCLKGVRFDSSAHYLPALIASGAVVALQAFKKNTLLSICVGTVLYMILIQQVFV